MDLFISPQSKSGCRNHFCVAPAPWTCPPVGRPWTHGNGLLQHGPIIVRILLPVCLLHILPRCRLRVHAIVLRVDLHVFPALRTAATACSSSAAKCMPHRLGGERGAGARWSVLL